MRKNLKDLRKKRGFSQKELAKKLDISERQYQRIEAGTSDGSVALWQNLKAILQSETIDCLLEQEFNQTNFENKR